MVGYRESKYSFNDPMDQWEQNFRNQKPKGDNRVIKGGYGELLGNVAGAVADKAALIGKGFFEMGARLLIPTYGPTSGKGLKVTPNTSDLPEAEYVPPQAQPKAKSPVPPKKKPKPKAKK